MTILLAISQMILFTIGEIVILNLMFELKNKNNVAMQKGFFVFVILMRNILFELDRMSQSDNIIWIEMIHSIFGIIFFVGMYKLLEGNFIDAIIRIEIVKLIMLASHSAVIYIFSNLFTFFTRISVNILPRDWSLNWMIIVIDLLWLPLCIHIIKYTNGHIKNLLGRISSKVKYILLGVMVLFPNELFVSPKVFDAIISFGGLGKGLIIAFYILDFGILATMLFVDMLKIKSSYQEETLKINSDYMEYKNMETIYNQLRVLRHDINNYIITDDQKYREEILDYCKDIKKGLGYDGLE
ncbi:MAG: hypothetical protein RR617_04715 [Anaerovoracaceae bacterium]